jgi:ferredoxin
LIICLKFQLKQVAKPSKADDENGEGCIACNVCYTGAPEFFKEDEDGNAYVGKQPTTAAEIELCQEQLEACPVASIGKDG